MTEKNKNGYFNGGGTWMYDPDGDLVAPVLTNLPHRLMQSEDGKVVDKYPGKTDNQVRQIDHEQAIELVKLNQKKWDDATEDERKLLGNRPEDLPELILPSTELPEV